MFRRTFQWTIPLLGVLFVVWLCDHAHAIDSRTRRIAALASLKGDRERGARLFHLSAAACNKCHAVLEGPSPLGPMLSEINQRSIATELSTAEYVAQSILHPSMVIRKAYKTVRVLTVDGQTLAGLRDGETDTQLRIRPIEDPQNVITIAKEEIEIARDSDTSLMPQKLDEVLGSERDLVDLVSYVTAVADGGRATAQRLQPDPSDLIIADDSIGLDHAGILRSINDDDIGRGRRIYNNHCKNCHGADGNQPTLPTARAFGTQPMKYGADPYAMFMTLTRGAGLMAPMQHLTPKERYSVIAFIRDNFMRGSNPQFQSIDDDYLRKLPQGTNSGETQETGDREYGAVLGSQIGRDVNNALTFRFDDDITLSYDLHRMRVVDAWSDGFLNLSQTQHYRQRGEQMPRIDGESLPGLGTWQWAFDEAFQDKFDTDDKPTRGPVRQEWMRYRGHYLHGKRAVMHYEIHDREILELPGSQRSNAGTTITHDLSVGPGESTLQIAIGRRSAGDGKLLLSSSQPASGEGRPATSGQQTIPSVPTQPLTDKPVSLNQHTVLIDNLNSPGARNEDMANEALHVIEGPRAQQLDLGTANRTITVRFRTKTDGTLIASAPAKGIWRPNAKTLFVRGGRVVFDIGWVGAIVGKTRVNDGREHTAVPIFSTCPRTGGRRNSLRADSIFPSTNSCVCSWPTTST
ncbi:MAG: DUF6797 domain-containing protein, partial [Planctomycetota bacterium]